MLVADLHRHDDYSLFDGFGKPLENARLAKEYGYEALGTTNHGTISVLSQFLVLKLILCQNLSRLKNVTTFVYSLRT